MLNFTHRSMSKRNMLTPEQIIDMKGLMGDSSDNIPGVPGVGEKTAIKLLKQFDSVEKLLESIDEVSGKKLKEKLEEFKDQALMSKELATIMTDAPIEVSVSGLEYQALIVNRSLPSLKILASTRFLNGLEKAVQKQNRINRWKTLMSKQSQT